MKKLIILIMLFFIGCSTKKVNNIPSGLHYVNQEVEEAVCYFESKDKKEYFNQQNLYLSHYDYDHFYLTTQDGKGIALPQFKCLLKMKVKKEQGNVLKIGTEKLIICNISNNYEFIGDHFYLVKEESKFVIGEHTQGEVYYFPRQYCAKYESKRNIKN